MTNELIIVKQLPIIEQQLLVIKAEIEQCVADALSLACTEETVKEVKDVRAALSKDFKALEERRIEVKKQVMSPYEAFEQIYKDCVTNIFTPADSKLKAKIAEVEDELKAKKKVEIREYYDELCTAKGIDFVSFEATGAVITLSASKKSLKEKVKACLDKTSDDLAMIDTQEYAAEILVEYKKSLNVSQAIMTVTNRNKAIEAERERAETARIAREQREAAAKHVDNVIEEQQAFSAPEETPEPQEFVEPQAVPVAEEPEVEKIYEASFKVRGTITKIKALKEYMITEGIEYESIH